MSEMASALANIVTQLHVQDTDTLKLVTELIHSVARIESRVSELERQLEQQKQFNIDMTLITDDLATQMVMVRHNPKDLDNREDH